MDKPTPNMPRSYYGTLAPWEYDLEDSLEASGNRQQRIPPRNLRRLAPIQANDSISNTGTVGEYRNPIPPWEQYRLPPQKSADYYPKQSAGYYSKQSPDYWSPRKRTGPNVEHATDPTERMERENKQQLEFWAREEKYHPELFDISGRPREEELSRQKPQDNESDPQLQSEGRKYAREQTKRRNLEELGWVDPDTDDYPGGSHPDDDDYPVKLHRRHTVGHGFDENPKNIVEIPSTQRGVSYYAERPDLEGSQRLSDSRQLVRYGQSEGRGELVKASSDQRWTSYNAERPNSDGPQRMGDARELMRYREAQDRGGLIEMPSNQRGVSYLGASVNPQRPQRVRESRELVLYSGTQDDLEIDDSWEYQRQSKRSNELREVVRYKPAEDELESDYSHHDQRRFVGYGNPDVLGRFDESRYGDDELGGGRRESNGNRRQGGTWRY